MPRHSEVCRKKKNSVAVTGRTFHGLWVTFVALAVVASSTGQTQTGQTPGQNLPPSTESTATPAVLEPSPAQASGQQPTSDDGVFVFKKEVEEVVLHATVVDEQRHLVPNLDRSTFTVLEDGVKQPITSFHREDVPVAMGIVIDNSGSMRDKREKVNEAVLSLLRESNPADKVFVVNFSADGYLDQDFTSDPKVVQAALHQVSMQGSTALYDAIVASSIHLKNYVALDNKALLVITDGRDNASRETLQEASLRLQQQSGPTLYAIGLVGGTLEGQDRDVLSSLAVSTGGAAYFPQSLNELNDITRTIGHDIRSRYSIGYKSTNPSQNRGYRRIQVQAQSPGYRQLVVRTRNGYYAGDIGR